MNVKNIKDFVTNLKKQYGSLYSNIIWSDLSTYEIIETYDNDTGIVIVIAERNRNKIFYAVAKLESLMNLMKNVTNGSILEYHYRDVNDMDEVFVNAGLEHYANYIRVTSIYEEKPYGKETGRQKLLDELYDPLCGEYPDISDVEELYNLTRDAFDPLIDDVFSVEEWKNIIRNKECLVIKENGKIVTFYVWRLEGKKLYSNMSLNLGPANYMYNLERRVFDYTWKLGIRVYYAWYNQNNVRAIKRGIMNPAAKQNNCMYDAIYIKN